MNFKDDKSTADNLDATPSISSQENKIILSRNLKFDFLKAIGILCIILAHTISGKQQPFLYQLRNFDVPLMVLVSGSLFWITSGNKNFAFLSYLKKRIPRLILPVWCFFLFFFAISYPISLLQGVKYPFHLKTIFYTFTLLIGGVGYVWIIRVFILIAIVSPLILKFVKLFANKNLFLLSLIPIYFSYEVLVRLRLLIPGIEMTNLREFLFQRIFINLFVDQIFLLLIPYGCVFALGIVIIQMSKKSMIWLLFLFLGCFTFLGVSYGYSAGEFVLTQSDKYPPKLYYLSYSLLMSILLYLASEYICKKHDDFLKKFNLDKLILFLGGSTLWIYLWHIFFLYYGEQFLLIFKLNYKLIPEFFVVSSLAILTVYWQKKIFSTIVSKLGNNYSSQLIKTLFLK